MSFGPLRAGLYSALLIFSVILLGLTAARVHHTKSLGQPDTISRGRTGYYDPSTVELLSTSILAILFSLPLMGCLCSRSGFGLPHFLTELLGILSLFILYLVGSAIFTHKYRNVGYCRGYFSQCRLVSAIMAFSWISWVITFFLLFAALAALLHFRKHGRDTHDRHRGAKAAAVGTAGALGTHEHEKHNRDHDANLGTTAAAAGTGAAVGGATGHHGHHTGYNDGKGSTGTAGYGTGTTGTGSDYKEGYRGAEPGTHHHGTGTGGYTTNSETRALDSSGPVSTGYNTSAV
ncbi:hypothetical protein C0995_005135 [Termitomyces sp. Mi166|nr:hypothetical protein C0995_005135 [Termitomyces sp. Mi166\